MRWALMIIILFLALAPVDSMGQAGDTGGTTGFVRGTSAHDATSTSEEKGLLQGIWDLLKEDAAENPWEALGVILVILGGIAGGAWAVWKYLFRWLVALKQRQIVEENEKLRKNVEELRPIAKDKERLEEELNQSHRKIAALELFKPLEWTPERKSRLTWDKAGENGFLRRLEVPDIRYTVYCWIEPQSQDLWRAGLIYYGRDLLDVQFLVHWGWEGKEQMYHIYSGYPIAEGVNLKPTTPMVMYKEQREHNILQVLVTEAMLYVRVGDHAFVFDEKDLGISPSKLSNPHLIAWCDNGVCDVKFTNIQIRPSNEWDRDYLNSVCAMTLRSREFRAAYLEADLEQREKLKVPKPVMAAMSGIRASLTRGNLMSLAEIYSVFQSVTLFGRDDLTAALQIMVALKELLELERGERGEKVYRLNPEYNPG